MADLRRYLTDDKEACLAVFDSVKSDYFDEAERKKFQEFLDQRSENYFVLPDGNDIIGCGGYTFDICTESGSRRAILVFGMIRRDQQNKGLGRKLTEKRIELIKQDQSFEYVFALAIPASVPFLEHLGFIAIEHLENGFGDGKHQITMVKMLNTVSNPIPRLIAKLKSISRLFGKS